MAAKAPEFIERGTLVESLWHAVNSGSGMLDRIPGLVRKIIQTEAWRERIHRGKIYTHERFVDFITANPMAGCGWSLDKVEALIRDDAELLALWREATTAAVGGRHKVNSDNITITPERGTSKSYTLDRLKRARPDLFEKVVAGEMSANAAAIVAGFRKQNSPYQQVLKLWVKLSKTEKSKIRALK